MPSISKAVFPVAGVARWRKSSTYDPMASLSELRPIVDKPIVQFAIEEARAAGIQEFIFVTCDEKAAIENHLVNAWSAHDLFLTTAKSTDMSLGEAIFVRQPKRRGIGHAILMARALLEDEPFAVIIPNLLVLGEAPPLTGMIKAYEPDTVLIGTSDMPDESLSQFGILTFDGSEENLVTKVVEKPKPEEKPSNIAAFGRWILPHKALDRLQTLSDDKEGEVTLTACINALATDIPVKTYGIEGLCYDLRQKKDLVRATVARALSHPEISPAVSEAYNDVIDSGVQTIRSVFLSRHYQDLTSLALLAQLIERDFKDELALVSSFGADSAILLHMIARIDPKLPVLFLDTDKLFSETLAFQRSLAETLGLEDVRIIRPDENEVRESDPQGDLYQRDPDACCYLRKTAPLELALAPFKAWITGRKRFQSKARATLPLFEEDGSERIKINPLSTWTREELKAYGQRYNLPAHPLVAKGYPSIGCEVCTSPVAAGENERAGRWRDSAKSECGIHLVDGKLVRVAGG